MSKPLKTYQPNMVREFFANYLSLAEKDCPKGSKISDFPNRESFPVKGATIDISACTLDMMLFWPDYVAPPASPKLKHHMTTAFT